MELPAGTTTDAGTVKAALLAPTATVAPPGGAAGLRVKTHVDEACEARTLGLQPSDIEVDGTPVVIVPPVAVIGTVLPMGEAPSASATPMDAPDVFVETVTVTTAATPLWIWLAFSPVNRQE